MTVFARDGVDAVRQIAEEAGVGVGTVYRHFPQRSDLIIAVFRREDACAEAAAALGAEYPAGEALGLASGC
jgi:AcrR family transcriptional regulator